MNFPALLRWQWDGYPTYHQNRVNLLLHIVAVPMFLFGFLVLLAGLTRLAPVPIIAGLAAMVVSLIMQGRGHKMEPVEPIPFSSPANGAARLFFEQWVTFPRFYLSGGWTRALRSSGKPPLS
jgi:hypothetical protein